MEQAQYWMWVRRKSLVSSEYSWEEKAFAEDHAAAIGSMGGCIWPPRSYSCSFCRREFRSAQALGGHMNVHRRDRARLKQSLITTHHHQNPLKSSSSPSPDHHQTSCDIHDVDDDDDQEQGKGSSSADCPGANKRSLNNSDIHVETNLSVGLNSVFFQTNCKRPKLNAVSTLPVPFLVSKELQWQVLGLKPASTASIEAHDLDLELRLGRATVPPKVK